MHTGSAALDCIHLTANAWGRLSTFSRVAAPPYLPLPATCMENLPAHFSIVKWVFILKSLSPSLPLARTTGLREGRDREEEGERERRERERRERGERRDRERREGEEEKRGREGRGEEGEREEKRGRRKQRVESRFNSGNGKWPCDKGHQANTARGKCTSGYRGMQAQREP
jgi:hypothetical protein